MAETATEIITIDATPDEVWGVAVDLERYPEWARDIKEVKIHQTDGEGRPSEVEFRTSALGRSTHYTLQYRYVDDPRQLGWSMIRGDIQRSIDGAFTFVPTSDVVGKVVALIWPFGSFHVLHRPADFAQIPAAG